MQDLIVRRLTPADAVEYRALMLQAYTEAPDAFTSTKSERAALDLAWWEQRLSVAEDARELVLGAFLGTQLLAVAGLAFEQSERTRHKAKLFGMYVAPAARSRGVAKSLIAAILAQSHARAGVELVQLTVNQSDVDRKRCGQAANQSDVDKPKPKRCGQAANQSDVDRQLSCSAVTSNVDRQLSCSAVTSNVDRQLSCSAGHSNVDRQLSCSAGQAVPLTGDSALKCLVLRATGPLVAAGFALCSPKLRA